MGLLDWFRRAPAEPPHPQLAALDAYLRRLGELEVKVGRLAAIELEWADYEDRLSRHLAKLTKRDQRGAKAEPRDPVEEGRRIFAQRFQGVTPIHPNGSET
jgi:hypothetical protein